ncbi:MAG: class I SAM-dependent methyltransferase [Kiritimatiellia bacterium]
MYSLVSRLRFGFMVFAFAIRDRLRPRERILAEAAIRAGYRVLDYGCGSGSYVIPAARRVGKTGIVYGLDNNPLAIEHVRRLADKHDLRNVQLILSDCATDLADESVDVVLLYDVLHLLSQPEKVLAELARILKPEGIMSVCDHHLRNEELVLLVTSSGRFLCEFKGRHTHGFIKFRNESRHAKAHAART